MSPAAPAPTTTTSQRFTSASPVDARLRRKLHVPIAAVEVGDERLGDAGRPARWYNGSTVRVHGDGVMRVSLRDRPAPRWLATAVGRAIHGAQPRSSPRYRRKRMNPGMATGRMSALPGDIRRRFDPAHVEGN